jgi:hypothetical protein
MLFCFFTYTHTHMLRTFGKKVLRFFVELRNVEIQNVEMEMCLELLHDPT